METSCHSLLGEINIQYLHNVVFGTAYSPSPILVSGWEIKRLKHNRPATEPRLAQVHTTSQIHVNACVCTHTHKCAYTYIHMYPRSLQSLMSDDKKQ
jgi:hypothetical protein